MRTLQGRLRANDEIEVPEPRSQAQPGSSGVCLDPNGWCDIDALLEGAKNAGVCITRSELDEIVETNEKRRFGVSGDGRRIRANQGHSIHVDLGCRTAEPPDVLYHGTATRHEESIMKQGLLRMNRHHVHLSPDRETAIQVGMRHGKVVVFKINSKAMREDGHTFYFSENGVWLVAEVPTWYIENDG